jgi:hypothetical protein
MQYDIESYVARESYSDRGYDDKITNRYIDFTKMAEIKHRFSR